MAEILEQAETLPVAKKVKISSNMPACDFCIDMASVSALRTAVEIMSHTLVDATFKVANQVSGTNLVLKVDAMDKGCICACKLKLQCSGRFDPNNSDFCVKLKPLLEILRALPSNEGIQVFRRAGSSDLELTSMGFETHDYKIKTLADEYSSVPFEAFDTEYSVDFDLGRLKSHLRVVQNLKADTVKIQIYKSPNNDDTSLLKLSCEGDDASASWTFLTRSDNRDVLPCFNNKNIDSDDMENVYSEAYSGEYLKNFCKSMERSSVTLSLSQGDTKFLVMEYNLGQENSSILFLLASKTED